MGQEDLEVEWLAPNRFMQPAERRRARYLLRQQKSLRDQEQRPANGEPLTKAQREKLDARWRASHARLEELSMDMLKRYLGVGKYSVLHVRRLDGLATLLQVLTAEVVFNDWNRRWMWCVNGRGLRKNGTLGFADADTCFNIADVRRRRLDGTWQRIQPVDDMEERA
jgi:hypothetical protein